MILAGWVGLVALLAPGAVLAESRTALVVGNGAYQDAPLKNPANDARDMAVVRAHMGATSAGVHTEAERTAGIRAGQDRKITTSGRLPRTRRRLDQEPRRERRFGM